MNLVGVATEYRVGGGGGGGLLDLGYDLGNLFESHPTPPLPPHHHNTLKVLTCAS